MSELVEYEGRLGVVLALETSGSLTQLGFTLPAEVTYEQYEAIGRGFGAVTEAMQWAVGDYIVQGEAVFGAESHQAIEALEISPASRSQYARVAERIPAERRVEGLTWSHHREVVALDPEQQDLWLGRAKDAGWSRQELADHLTAQKEPSGEKKTGKQILEEALEIVKGAADRVYSHADRTEGGDFVVPAEDMEALGRALGIIETG